jgi:O-antigen ligase
VFAASASDWLRENVPMLQESHQRIEAFLGGPSDLDHADDSRVHIAREYWELVQERPWQGWGTGLNYSGDEGSHNIYLARWVENGVAGLAMYLVLLASLLAMGARRQSPECQVLAAYLFVLGFFTHNLLEDRSLLLVWGVTLGRGAIIRAEWTSPRLLAPEPARARFSTPARQAA